jgi:phage terminase small subunit
MKDEWGDLKKEWESLRPKQQQWIEYYCKTGNATESARQAGYKITACNGMGSQNLSKLGKFVARRMETKSSEMIASQEEVLHLITKMARGELEEEVVVVESRGRGVSSARTLNKRTGNMERMRALSQLARIHQLDKMKVEVSGDDGFLQALNATAEKLDWEESE